MPPAQGDDLVALFELLEQRLFEVDQPDAENHAGPVEFDKLPGCRFERLGAGPGRYEHLDREVLSDDAFHDAAQRQDRDAERVALRFRGFGAAGKQPHRGE